MILLLWRCVKKLTQSDIFHAQFLLLASYMFLGKSGSFMSCTVTKPRRYFRDLFQGGLAISCTLEFKVDKVFI